MEIINLLLDEPLSRDEIMQKISQTHTCKMHEISATLSILEIKGLIEEKLGQLHLRN